MFDYLLRHAGVEPLGNWCTFLAKKKDTLGEALRGAGVLFRLSKLGPNGIIFRIVGAARARVSPFGLHMNPDFSMSNMAIK